MFSDIKMQIQYFAEIVSEFSGFHHTPGFKASRSTGDFEKFSGTKNSRRASTESTTSNHSIRIPVGVDDVPILSTTSSSNTQQNHPHFTKNFATSPSISRMASLSRVQEKLQRKIKRSKSEESLESLENQNSRKSSTTTSYRLMV
ncbi:hypothetical protein CRE_23501 [Caenorhabditis remanei]|uniref:Uncharacterized protein n=1 Tax=Caenorhabditis remanei TaxID=31234 RepID=E3MH18_CAERE|nr:hypothetical protein CRE_23501 [Caenorhabditis remanei]